MIKCPKEYHPPLPSVISSKIKPFPPSVLSRPLIPLTFDSPIIPFPFRIGHEEEAGKDLDNDDEEEERGAKKKRKTKKKEKKKGKKKRRRSQSMWMLSSHFLFVLLSLVLHFLAPIPFQN